MIAITAEETMQRVKRSRWHAEWRVAPIPISIGLLLMLHYVVGVPLWIVACCFVWIPLYYVAYPALLRKKWTQFEKVFARDFQRGAHKKLLTRYKKSWFLRRFGPRAEMLGKLGLIYAAMSRNREAEQALERAVDEAKGIHRDRLLFNLANVKFELGKREDAAAYYRALRPTSPYRHAAATHLAILDMQAGRRTEQARATLEREMPRAQGPIRAHIEAALAAPRERAKAPR